MKGPCGGSRHQVSGLKFGCILRFATEARAQGALLTLPDLAVLMGIHVDTLRRQFSAHPEVVVHSCVWVKGLGRNTTTFPGTPGWTRPSSNIPTRSWMPKRNAVRFSGCGREIVAENPAWPAYLATSHSRRSLPRHGR